jgi:hypothetical protein
MIDSILNFANFLDDTDFFNAILEYISTLIPNRHMNTLFQYKDIQSHNEKLQRYLLKIKIRSQRDHNTYLSKETQREYINKLEFLGVSTLPQLNIEPGHQNIVFRTQECGIVSVDSHGYLFSIIDNVKDVSDIFLTLINGVQAPRSGVLFVYNMEKFLSSLLCSKFVPNIDSDKFDQSRCRLFRGSTKKIIEEIKTKKNLNNFNNLSVRHITK